MALVLTIENEQSLPNGAPVSVRLTDKRGIDIGRSATTDWPLPDPSRFISGRHCEVRYRDGGYWLNDLSTNGTFLNDSARRVQTPHRLRHGDRLAVGSYVIAVAIEAEDVDEAGLLAPVDGETTASRATGDTPLAPIEQLDAARLDAEIAQAVASESAPIPASLIAQAEGAGGAGASVFAAAQGSPAGVAAIAREGAAPTTRPHTMVRARGFNASAAPAWVEGSLDPSDERARARGSAQGQAQDAPAMDPAPVAPLEVKSAFDDALDPREREARAWSAPSGAPAVDPQPSIAAAAVEPGPAPAAAVGAGVGADEFLRRFAKGAGVPDHIFARQDGLKVAEELGALMRMTVEDLTQLLNARFKAKRFARASSQTMIQALDNNPLKFAPTATDALKIMFGPRTSGYLDAKRAIDGAFTDLKAHQVMTFAAMQQAVRMLVEDLDPQVIEDSAGEDKSLAALFGARKARLWDLFVARWQAKTLRHEDGLVDAFMLYFAQCYDQNKETK